MEQVRVELELELTDERQRTRAARVQQRQQAQSASSRRTSTGARRRRDDVRGGDVIVAGDVTISRRVVPGAAGRSSVAESFGHVQVVSVLRRGSSGTRRAAAVPRRRSAATSRRPRVDARGEERLAEEVARDVGESRRQKAEHERRRLGGQRHRRRQLVAIVEGGETNVAATAVPCRDSEVALQTDGRKRSRLDVVDVGGGTRRRRAAARRWPAVGRDRRRSGVAAEMAVEVALVRRRVVALAALVAAPGRGGDAGCRPSPLSAARQRSPGAPGGERVHGGVPSHQRPPAEPAPAVGARVAGAGAVPRRDVVAQLRLAGERQSAALERALAALVHRRPMSSQVVLPVRRVAAVHARVRLRRRPTTSASGFDQLLASVRRPSSVRRLAMTDDFALVRTISVHPPRLHRDAVDTGAGKFHDRTSRFTHRDRLSSTA